MPRRRVGLACLPPPAQCPRESLGQTLRGSWPPTSLPHIQRRQSANRPAGLDQVVAAPTRMKPHRSEAVTQARGGGHNKAAEIVHVQHAGGALAHVDGGDWHRTHIRKMAHEHRRHVRQPLDDAAGTIPDPPPCSAGTHRRRTSVPTSRPRARPHGRMHPRRTAEWPADLADRRRAATRN